MNKEIMAVIIGILLISGLAGCGSSQGKNGTSMKGMPMGNQQSLSKAFQDELNGFTTIERDVKKGDYKSASTIGTRLHDEFHAAILPQLEAKKGNTYAEEIHGKYDELQDAIASNNRSKIIKLIKENRDNLQTVARILDVSLN